jgi:hypothetical protein
MAPDMPVTVTWYVPGTAELVEVNIRVLVVVVLLGLNEAVTPLGTPDAARETLPVNPPWSCTVMVVVPEKPTYDPVITGGAESAKPGA